MPLKILIVDDDTHVHRIFASYLREDYQLQSAFGGNTGMSMALGQSFDLAFVDINMPTFVALKWSKA